MENTVKMISLVDYSEYREDKCRNGGAYGYDDVYIYDKDTDSFTCKSVSTCELTPVSESYGYILADVLYEVANFIHNNINTPGCAAYVDGVVIWKSIPAYCQDIDQSDLYLDE